MKNDLIVLVKKYFDKANGNTYHSVQFEYDNKIYHSGKTYGYERQYEETFRELFIKEINEYMQDKGIERYIVIENCKAKELKEIHKYK